MAPDPQTQDRFNGAMRRALAAHQAGRLNEAAAAYEEALQLVPDQPDALNFSGYLAHQRGDNGRAFVLIERSLALAGERPAYLCNLAKVQQATGRLAEAVTSYRRALALDPEEAQAQYNLAVLEEAQGDVEAAVASYRKAATLRPGDSRPVTNLANLLHTRGQDAEAADLYRRATEINPKDLHAWTNWGALLFESGHDERAADCLRRALEIDPEHATALLHLGRIAKLAGQGEEAQRLFRRAVQADPNHADAHCTLAILAAEAGDFDAAIAGHRKALELEPKLTTAYLNLSAAKRFEAGDADIAAMERLLGDVTLPDDKATDLRFALGKAYDDIGDTETAFRHYAEGNALKRRNLDFDLRDITDQFERTMTVFDAAFLAQRSGSGCPSTLPIFIVGMPRSGTSLVEQILASHPEVYGAGELEVLPKLLRDLPKRLSSGEGFPDCTPLATAGDWQRLGEDYARTLQDLSPDASRITDKAPSNFAYVGPIHLMLPNATIIHCTREPLDTCLSCFTNLFGRGVKFAYDLEELGRFYRHHTRLMRHWQEVLPGRVHELRYEDLIADPEPVTRGLLEACGLPWHEASLAPQETRRAVRTASLAQVRQPIYTSSRERWRRYEPYLDALITALNRTDQT